MHLTSCTAEPLRKPATISSPMCFGSGALAEYAVTGSRPSATATGIRPSGAARRSARPSLWICQCMNVERRSIFCIRYMPTLRTPVAWSLVITAGSVMNGAGSSGQQRWIGSTSRFTSSPVSTISWQAAFDTSFGIESAIDLSLPSERTLSTSPCGGCSSRISPSLSARSSSFSTPNAMHMRFSVPNWLIRSGCAAPFGFSNRSAGPPDLTTRSTISVISRSGSTSAEMRTSSPFLLEEGDPFAQVGGG